MLNFTRHESTADVQTHIDKIKTLSSKIEQKIAEKTPENDNFIESLSVEELKDLRQLIMAADYLLSKYQDKKDTKAFLEEFIGIILHAANSVNTMRDDLEDLVISAEMALEQIQTLHEEVTQNLALGRFTQTKIDDFKVTKAAPLPSPNNLTNTATPIYTQAYLKKSLVEI